MKQREEVISNENSQVSPGFKSFEETLKWLSEKVDIIEIPLSSFTNFFLESQKFNAINAITNNNLHLSSEDFEFIAYKLLSTSKNEAYNEKLEDEKFVYILFELRTRYVISNSAKLQLEIVIQQGIGQYDYENNTEYLLYYISCIDRLKNKEY